MITLTMAALLAAMPLAVSGAHGGSVASSEYTGHYYMVNPDESTRRCIVERESNNHPSSLSRGGHGGLYQMTEALWIGAVWMMTGDPIDPITSSTRKALQAKPVWKVSRYWQTRAFWTVYNYTGKASGAKHWAGGRWSC